MPTRSTVTSGDCSNSLSPTRRWPTLLQLPGWWPKLRLTDPDCVLVVDFPGKKVFLGEAGTGVTAAFELDMQADVAHAVWLGRIQPATLLATRRVRVRGSARKLLRMQSLGERLIPVYEKLLCDANREDLLAAPA